MWIDDSLEPHENFTGPYKVPDISSNTLVFVIKDTWIRLNLSLKGHCGQCYDEASKDIDVVQQTER